MKMGLRSINESLREAVDIPGSICIPLEEFDEDTDIGVCYDGFTFDPIDHIDETEDFRAVIRPMEY